MDDEELASKLVCWQKKPKPDNFSNIRDLVKNILDNDISPKQSRFGSLPEIWYQLLPQELAEQTRPDKISAGQLTVICNSPAYANEIRWCQDVLVEQLKKKCPKAHIKKIKIVFGKV